MTVGLLMDVAVSLGALARLYQLIWDWKAMGLGGFRYQYCGLSILSYLGLVGVAILIKAPVAELVSIGAILLYCWIIDEKVSHAIQNRFRRPTRRQALRP